MCRQRRLRELLSQEHAMRRILLAIFLGLILGPSSSHAASMRCGSDLVSDRATRAEVLLKCGDPMTQDVRTEVQRYKRREPDGRGGHLVEEIAVEKVIDEWVYNFGPHH